MLPEKIKSIIASCKTIEQCDTCTQWAEYIFNAESLTECKMLVQRQRNAINLRQGNLDDIYDVTQMD